MYKTQLINNPEHVVDDLIRGILYSNSNLVKLEGCNVLLRKDFCASREEQVSLLSGGGSGHEPAHAGFIGEGMLTGAILGNVFASPSVESIYQAIKATGGSKGVLLIVKNYTGDRLNFAMAMERAKQENIRIKMVIVEDDCALIQQNKGITGGRGIAGTILYHKILGAAAALGKSLDELVSIFGYLAHKIFTLGVALSTCTLPGQPVHDRLHTNTKDNHNGLKFEIGMGIHGEAGNAVGELSLEANINKNNASYIADILVTQVMRNFNTTQNETQYNLIVMLNNLGTLPILEFHIMIKEVMESLNTKCCSTSNVDISRLITGTLMTSLDMTGISLTVMLLNRTTDQEIIQFLDTSTSAGSWPGCVRVNDSQYNVAYRMNITIDDKNNNPTSSNNIDDNSSDCTILMSDRFTLDAILFVSHAIVQHEETITAYDLICGDGDCGIVMKKGAQEVIRTITVLIDNNNTIPTVALCNLLADSISRSMGGTSGALLELCFRNMANHFKDIQTKLEHSSRSEPTIEHWTAALVVGGDAISRYGGASLGMRTMLDSLLPAIDALKSGITAAADAATQGVENTKTMGSLAGRSNYVNSSILQGTPDPGAYAVAIAFKALDDFHKLL